MATEYPRRLSDAIEGAAFEFGGYIANDLNQFLNDEDLVVSREMQASIRHETRREGGTLEVVAVFDAEHANYVHDGTKPHWPPKGVLLDWIQFRNFAPDAGTLEQREFLLRRHISEEGTKANPFLERYAEEYGEENAERFRSILQKRIDQGD